MDPATDIPPQSRTEQNKESFLDNVRKATPASIVNNASRLNSLIRLSADSVSIYGSIKYPAPFRTAASAISLSALAAGIIIPEKTESQEQRDAYKRMSAPEYVGVKVSQAFDPKNHIAATIGLATIANGMLTTVQGISHTRTKGWFSKEILTGALTIAAGSALNFIPDQEKAWQISNGLFYTRLPFSAWDAHTHHTKDGNVWQWTKLGLNQAANTVGVMYGGIKKDEHGNIIRVDDTVPQQPQKQPEAKISTPIQEETVQPAQGQHLTS